MEGDDGGRQRVEKEGGGGEREINDKAVSSP